MGIEPIIFEKENECGGRIKNVTVEGSQVPLGAIMFTPEYSAFVNMIRELGLEESIERIPLSQSALLTQGEPLPLNASSLATTRRLSLRTKLEVRRLWRQLGKLEPWAYSKETMQTTLTEYLQAFISDETIELIVRPAVNAFFQDADRIAAAVGLQLLKSLPKVHILTGGNAMLTQALAAKLRDSVQVNSEVKAARRENTGWKLQTPSSLEEVDLLICATTLSQARILFPDEKIQPISYAPVNVLVVKGSFRYQHFRILIDSDWRRSEIHSVKNFGPVQVIHARTPTPKLDRLYDRWERVHLVHWDEALPVTEPGTSFQPIETGTPGLYLCGDFYLGGRMESAMRCAASVVASIRSHQFG